MPRLGFPVLLWVSTAGLALTGAQAMTPNPVQSTQQLPDGLQAKLEKGYLRLQVCTDSVIHVVYSLERTIPARPDLVLTKVDCPHPGFRLDTSDAVNIVLSTQKLKIQLDRTDSSMKFLDADGHELAWEYSHTLQPAEINGEKTLHAERFVGIWHSQEAFYGLGQHQAGVWNYRGEAVDLAQINTNISVPFVLSSNGYGILWNNGSRSRFNNRMPHAFYLTSEVADAVDYFFIYGPEFDSIIAAYRMLTGTAPLFGKWAYGYWQSKSRYASQQEVLNIAHRYRKLHIPLDNLAQDFRWWDTMGAPVFNKNFPDPREMATDLHENNVHLLLSVWTYFENGSALYQEMERRRFFIDKSRAEGFFPAGTALYDAFNPEARKHYWKLLCEPLFNLGVDAWWMDTTEPDSEGEEPEVLLTHQVALGNGARYANEFPLAATAAVYVGQRAESDQKRVFILSRSGYAGIQRYAAAVWSGDVDPTWETFRRQIPAGLNLSISGIPYWTSDIGGFLPANPDDPAYRELYVRWFEFGAFCPIFRAHGTRTTNENEIWSYGPDAEAILTAYDRLRYRLMPYIYSLAWKVTSEGYTIMRPLVMDFRADVRAQNTGDEYNTCLGRQFSWLRSPSLRRPLGIPIFPRRSGSTSGQAEHSKEVRQ
jgi:alpha-D-xyloside xylohydrolase